MLTSPAADASNGLAFADKSKNERPRNTCAFNLDEDDAPIPPTPNDEWAEAILALLVLIAGKCGSAAVPAAPAALLVHWLDLRGRRADIMLQGGQK
jgi:hypothetical protein